MRRNKIQKIKELTENYSKNIKALQLWKANAMAKIEKKYKMHIDQCNANYDLGLKKLNW